MESSNEWTNDDIWSWGKHVMNKSNQSTVSSVKNHILQLFESTVSGTTALDKFSTDESMF
jgi:hypothetical protein